MTDSCAALAVRGLAAVAGEILELLDLALAKAEPVACQHQGRTGDLAEMRAHPLAVPGVDDSEHPLGMGRRHDSRQGSHGRRVVTGLDEGAEIQRELLFAGGDRGRAERADLAAREGVAAQLVEPAADLLAKGSGIAVPGQAVADAVVRDRQGLLRPVRIARGRGLPGT